MQFRIDGRKLYGILHLPKSEDTVTAIVLMVIGGPQTRVGSHRLFVQLARWLCANDVAVFRFDYEGMGDSDGNFVGFEHAGPSIKSAIDFLFAELACLKRVMLWSLCDGAAASIMYGPTDRNRIAAMILGNPYVQTELGHAKAILKHYYYQRLFQQDFWHKVFRCRFNLVASVHSFLALVTKRFLTNSDKTVGSENPTITSLPTRVLDGIFAFNHRLYFLISTNDMTGMEFFDLLKNNATAQKLIRKRRISIRFIDGADHTFSNIGAKKAAFEQTLAIIREVSNDV